MRHYKKKQRIKLITLLYGYVKKTRYMSLIPYPECLQ